VVFTQLGNRADCTINARYSVVGYSVLSIRQSRRDANGYKADLQLGLQEFAAMLGRLPTVGFANDRVLLHKINPS
jgi:hypothetical protein